MQKTILGRTNLTVSRVGFGALPIQRVDMETAKRILRKAYDNGINFFDTARGYTDSEEKIGNALSDVRENIIIASKTPGRNKKEVLEHLETSLRYLKTDYIDIYQLHNPKTLPDPNDPDSTHSALLEAKEKGLIRFIGITNHKLNLAIEAVKSGLYDTVQFPLNCLSSDEDLQLVDLCKQHNVGFIAMKAMGGGLITSPASTFAFLWQFSNVVPIWGIQHEWELDEFLALEKSPPAMDEKMLEMIEKDRAELAGSYCRGCGYCMPCPVGIEINTSARISLLLKRSPIQNFITDEYRNKMELITKCKECGQCRAKCPYELDTPSLLKTELKKYREFIANLKA